MPFLKTFSGKIYYEIHGNSNGTLIVFTHGAGMDHAMFKSQLLALTRDYKILLWDMPGHGNSHPVKEKFTFSSVADKLIMLLNQINGGKAVLVGQSLGGYIAQYTAYHYPEYVKALGVIGCTPLHHRPDSQDKLVLKMASEVFHSKSGEIFEENMWNYFAQQIAITPTAIKYAKESMERVGKNQLSIIFDGLIHETNTGIEEPPDNPTLITHGSQEIIGNVWKYAPVWHSKVKNSRYVVIPYAGHNANQDNPVFFNSTLMSFLSYLEK